MVHNQGMQSGSDCLEPQCPGDTAPDYIGALLSPAGTYSANVVENANMLFFVDRVSGLRYRGPGGN